MEEVKTTSGVVKLIRDGIVMAEKKYSYNSHNGSKDLIIDGWKHRYGKKFYECEVHVVNIPINEKVYIKPPMYRERLRTKIPEYFISNLPNFKISELLKLQKMVNEEVNLRFG